MYLKIKELADAAVALQNKDQMDATLREISAICSLVSDEGSALVGFMVTSTSADLVIEGDHNPGVSDFPDTENKPSSAKAKKGGAK